MNKLAKKTFRITLKTLSTIAVLSILFFIFYWYNNHLFLFETKLLWPQKSFREASFKNGNIEEKASMTVDLIENKILINSECKKVPEALGKSTGDYYHNDASTTYKLTEKESANWILTFVCNNQGTVEKVFIRKSCCSFSQIIFFKSAELVQPLLKMLLKP